MVFFIFFPGVCCWLCIFDFLLCVVALFIVIVLPMVTLPPPEVRFQVEFRIGQDPHDLNRLLTHLELGDIDFDINGLIFPVMWPAARAHDSPVTDLFMHWVPWDEPLSADLQVHLYVAHTPLFESLDTLAHHLQGQISMVAPQIPRIDRSETLVVIHPIPIILILELIGQVSQQVGNLERRIMDTEATVQLLRNH